MNPDSAAWLIGVATALGIASLNMPGEDADDRPWRMGSCAVGFVICSAAWWLS